MHLKIVKRLYHYVYGENGGGGGDREEQGGIPTPTKLNH